MSQTLQSQIEARCVAIADTVVPNYRNGKRAYSCTSQVARMWQAAYDGAAVTLRGGDKITHPAATGSVREAVSATLLGEVMQDAWSEICDDAGAHPSDMKHGRGTVLFYSPGHWTSLIALRLNERLAAAPTPDAAASEAGEVLPQHIGRLHLGERRSDGKRLCSHGHPVAVGQALYWPERLGEYPDDIDPLCLAHAIEQAVDDNGWCECDARAALTGAEA